MRFKFGFVQRALLTVAVPAIGISLVWPVQWEAPMTQVRGGVVEHFTRTVFLRDDARVQLGGLAVFFVWMYLLWLRRGLWTAGTPLSKQPPQPASAP